MAVFTGDKTVLVLSDENIIGYNINDIDIEGDNIVDVSGVSIYSRDIGEELINNSYIAVGSTIYTFKNIPIDPNDIQIEVIDEDTVENLVVALENDSNITFATNIGTSVIIYTNELVTYTNVENEIIAEEFYCKQHCKVLGTKTIKPGTNVIEIADDYANGPAVFTILTGNEGIAYEVIVLSSNSIYNAVLVLRHPNSRQIIVSQLAPPIFPIGLEFGNTYNFKSLQSRNLNMVAPFELVPDAHIGD
jgi:hypothetical protein